MSHKMKKGTVTESSKLVHPNSRKAAMMTRKIIRFHRLERNKGNRDVNVALKSQKVLWFKHHLPDEETLTPDQVTELVERYLHRFDDELDQINIVNNIKGRRKNQHASRSDAIKFTSEKEIQQFNESGFEIPDLLSRKVIENLRNWDEEPKNLSNIKQRKYTRVTLQKLAKNNSIEKSVMDQT